MKKDFAGNILSGAFSVTGLCSLLAIFSVYYFEGFLYVTYATFFFIFLMIYAMKPSIIGNMEKKTAWLWFFAWIIVFSLVVMHIHLPRIRYVLYSLYGFCFLLLNTELQNKIVRLFAILLSMLFGISLIEYFIYNLAGIGIVVGSVLRPSNVNNDIYCDHLLFNIIYQDLFIPRFCSLTEEPGLVGTLCGFMLFYTSKDKSLRLPFVAFVICGMFSLSLAYFILLVIFLIVQITSVKKAVLYIFIILVAFGSVLYYNYDLFEIAIVDRITEKDDVSELDNRTDYYFDQYFEKSVKSGNIFWGEGMLPQNVITSGAKRFFYIYGIAGFLVVFFVYMSIYKKKAGGKLAFADLMFLIAFWASFYQRDTIVESYTFLAFTGVALNGGEARARYKINQTSKYEI